MSARTIVYKVYCWQLKSVFITKTYRMSAAFPHWHWCIKRFSTNTFPEMAAGPPFSSDCPQWRDHTVKGNVNWMRAREGVMKSTVLGDDLQKLFPLIDDVQSDTACFDDALELLLMAGYPIAQAMMMMIPEAWGKSHVDGRQPPRLLRIPRRVMDRGMALPRWRSPMVVTRGTLDRNGCVPAAYIVTDDDLW